MFPMFVCFHLQIWRKYDVDCSGYISAQELKVRSPDKVIHVGGEVCLQLTLD